MAILSDATLRVVSPVISKLIFNRKFSDIVTKGTSRADSRKLIYGFRRMVYFMIIIVIIDKFIFDLPGYWTIWGLIEVLALIFIGVLIGISATHGWPEKIYEITELEEE